MRTRSPACSTRSCVPMRTKVPRPAERSRSNPPRADAVSSQCRGCQPGLAGEIHVAAGQPEGEKRLRGGNRAARPAGQPRAPPVPTGRPAEGAEPRRRGVCSGPAWGGVRRPWKRRRRWPMTNIPPGGSTSGARMEAKVPEALDSSFTVSWPSLMRKAAWWAETWTSSGKRMAPRLRPTVQPLAMSRKRCPRAGPDTSPRM